MLQDRLLQESAEQSRSAQADVQAEQVLNAEKQAAGQALALPPQVVIGGEFSQCYHLKSSCHGLRNTVIRRELRPCRICCKKELEPGSLEVQPRRGVDSGWTRRLSLQAGKKEREEEEER